jgi:hypothetical protein
MARPQGLLSHLPTDQLLWWTSARPACNAAAMALTLRRTRLEKQPVFADLQDWQVLEDGKEIGRIYEQHAPAGPDQAWGWSITVPLDMRAKVVTSGRAPTRSG